MPTLRIKHAANRVLSSLEGGETPISEDRPLSFKLSTQDAVEIRWYLEDYPIYPTDPQPAIAKGIEQRMAEAGRELFRQIFEHSDVWQAARRHLNDTRIEIETEVDDALVPWELLRDPVADLPLALAVPSFVRCHSRPALAPDPPKPVAGKIRILVAICRPGGEGDVPFRSVARHLIRGLSKAARESFDLEVLRPPTFEQLAKRLREAKAKGEPFHALHFDGHGLSGKIFFENPKLDRNAEPVNASEPGKLLHETQVPLLILNACRSADNEPPERPEQVSDLHEQIRQFGSFAHAIMDYGATGVVAWRYSVFVNTAAQYMLDLYGALSSGMPLGEAATLARKQLSAGNRQIEAWTVPVVFAAVPARLFPKAQESPEIRLQVPTASDSGLPMAPDIGFIGRDETILKLDRTFDDQNIVLLHAYAGSGKTSTAAEFVGWYQQTGGLAGPVLFTSFEQQKTLPRVLDDLGRVFERELSKNGIQWLTLTDPQRRDVALQLLRQAPIFWIWDNVEPIAGFPAGAASLWSAEEQREFSDFLRAARDTKAKFLLTSRRDEHGWLHDLPARIELPPMPFAERVLMTEALAQRHGRRLEDVDDWRPLLRFTQGNPLTLTVLVGQALRDGLKTRTQIEEFVRKLQAGEDVFADEASEGRTRSLAASLDYGFQSAFTESERKQLALLHLFQGFVQVASLQAMGDPSGEWCLPEVRGLTRESGTALLDRAAEVGLLTQVVGGGYTIHPALPWFFRRLFEHYYSETPLAIARAFVEAMDALGNHYSHEYGYGIGEVIGVVAAEEANLLHARSLARANGWWHSPIATMQGLHQLYDHTGRRAEWARLVEEVVPDFVDPETEGSLPGKDDEWSFVAGYRVGLAREARQWDDAARLQKQLIAWERSRAAAILAKPNRQWDVTERNVVRTLAVSLHELAQIRRERGLATCVDGYQEALSLAEKVSDQQLGAICAFNLGHAYEELAEIRDLSLAEQWYMRSLNTRLEHDGMGRAACLSGLGNVAYRRCVQTENPSERRAHLEKAAAGYQQALRLTPENALREMATVHNQLGLIHSWLGQIDTALHHYRKSVRYKEAMHDRFGAGGARSNAARALASAGRFTDALAWAQAALRDFQACEKADDNITKTLNLIQRIESDLQATSPPSSEHPPPPH